MKCNFCMVTLTRDDVDASVRADRDPRSLLHGRARKLCVPCIDEVAECFECGAVGWYSWVLRPGDHKAQKRCLLCASKEPVEAGQLF